MVIISGQSLICFEDYLDKKVKLKIVHFCPIDGKDTDDKCKRTVITNDCSSANSSTDRYVVVIFYGHLAKTPFKKSCLKEGQLFTLQRFKTSVMPKNKVFKCNIILMQDLFLTIVYSRQWTHTQRLLRALNSGQARVRAHHQNASQPSG